MRRPRSASGSSCRCASAAGSSPTSRPTSFRPTRSSPRAPRQHLLTLRSVDDDAEPDETLAGRLGDRAGRARRSSAAALPQPDGFDDPRRFDAFLDAVRWGATSNADPRHYLAPFQSGIEIDGTSSTRSSARSGCRASSC